jgi:rSAM/selenodomain-associated transferase 1
VSNLARLCIFARAPVLHKVKTRLASSIGAQAALAAHEELVSLALSQMAKVPGLASELWIAGPTDHPTVVQWSEGWQLPIVAQQGDDLGARMSHALQRCLDEGAQGLVVGTDCPAITSGYVQRAARSLNSHDLVLGPAEDGGYGLIGLRKPAPALFEDIHWGTDTVLRETLDRALRVGLSYELLPTIWDVDTAADWDRFRARRSS